MKCVQKQAASNLQENENWAMNKMNAYNLCNWQRINTQDLGRKGHPLHPLQKEKTMEIGWQTMWACASQKTKWSLAHGKMLSFTNIQSDTNLKIKRCHFTPIRLAKIFKVWQYELLIWRYKTTAKQSTLTIEPERNLAIIYEVWGYIHFISQLVLSQVYN